MGKVSAIRKAPLVIIEGSLVMMLLLTLLVGVREGGPSSSGRSPAGLMESSLPWAGPLGEQGHAQTLLQRNPHNPLLGNF